MSTAEDKLDKVLSEQASMRVDVLTAVHAVEKVVITQGAEIVATARDVAEAKAEIAIVRARVDQLERFRWIITGAALVGGGLAGELVRFLGR